MGTYMNPFASIPKPAPDSRGANILVADDEPAVRLVLSFMLRQLGYNVTVVEDGAAAVAVFAANPRRIGTVLLDVHMPGLNGIAAMRHIRELAPDVRIVLTSGTPRVDVISRWAPEPPWTFLEKPFQISELRDVLPKLAKAA